MNRIFLSVVVMLFTVGCASRGIHGSQTKVELVEKSHNKGWLLIQRQEWLGKLTAEGFIGYQHREYRVDLEGAGPVFQNPRFLDVPPDVRCIGIVSVDIKRMRVTVNMNRIVESSTGTPQKTVPHPANGIHIINSVRSAAPHEF